MPRPIRQSDSFEIARQLIEPILAIEINELFINGYSIKDFCKKNAFHNVQKSTQPAFLISFIENIKECEVKILTDSLQISFVFFKVDGRYICLGPFSYSILDEKECIKILINNGLNKSYLASYRLFKNQFPIISGEKILTATLTLVEFLSNSVRKIRSTSIYLSPDRHIHYSDEEFEQHNLNIKVIQDRYQIESKLFLAVQKGDVTSALKWFGLIRLHFHYPENDSRAVNSARIGAANLRTMLRMALLRSGLSPISIHTLTHEYTKKYEQATSLNEINELHLNMINDMCKLVLDYNTAYYGVIVKKAMSYLTSHISISPSVQQIACEIGVSPNYLSYLFKQETGFTIREFINKQKIEYSSELLITTDLSVREIGDSVGIFDQNYFAKMFKKYMEVSPSIYRKMKNNNPRNN